VNLTALVIELCDRGSLDQLLGIESGEARALVLSPTEVWQLALGIACGVAHLHRARIVHRDLATRNILVSSPLTPKVCDFGMSRLLGQDETAGTTGGRRNLVATTRVLFRIPCKKHVLDAIFTIIFDVRFTHSCSQHPTLFVRRAFIFFSRVHFQTLPRRKRKLTGNDFSCVVAGLFRTTRAQQW
jgi:serine/threonine protein kinase